MRKKYFKIEKGRKRPLYLVYFFMKFDKMQSDFNFVHVIVSFLAIQIKVLFLIFCLMCFGRFFLAVIKKISQIVILQNIRKYALIKTLKTGLKLPKIEILTPFYKIS